jgi:hypothetical protein
LPKGTKYWLENVDEKVLESIEFVLALDTIVGSTFESDNKSHDRIYLHVSRPPKEEHIKRLYSVLPPPLLTLMTKLPLNEKCSCVSDHKLYRL